MRIAVVIAILCSVGGAFAQPSPPSSAGNVIVSPWQEQFAEARKRMLAGEFDAAAPLFESLAASAPSVEGRAMAQENASLCRAWSKMGAVVHFRDADGQLSISLDARNNRRTTGELAGLYISSVLYGIGSGITLAVYTEPDSAAAGILPTLALAGASAGLVYLLDSSTGLGYGVPQSASSGLSLGFFSGLAWTMWHFASVDSQDEWSGKTITTLIWGASTAGAVVGGLLGDRLGTSPGRAAFLETAGRWTGLTLGLAAAALPENDDEKDDVGWLAGAVGLAAGSVGGYFLGREHNPSTARSRFIDLGGIAGGLVGGGLYLSVAGDNSEARPALLVTSLGIASGLGLSWYLTRNLDPDPPPSSLERSGPTLTTIVAPTADGEGFTLGVGGTL